MAQQHACMGLVVIVDATYFGSAWAKQTFKADWATKKLKGTVVEYKPARGKNPEKWGLKFEEDPKVYMFLKETMLQYGALPRLLEGGGAEDGAWPTPSPAGSIDLRSPGRGLEAGGRSARGAAGEVQGEAAGRPVRTLRQRPSGRLNFDATSSSETESEADPQSEEVDGGAGPSKPAGAAGNRGGAAAGQPRRPTFSKRKAKGKARKKVSKRLLEGESSGSEEEDHSDGELEEEGGNPLEHDEGEEGPSGEMEWEQVEEGDTLEDLKPPAFTGLHAHLFCDGWVIGLF